VGPETLANYQKHWGAFLKWCRVKASDITNMAILDSQVTAYLEFLYLEGEDLSAANYLVASVMFHVPGCKGLSTLPKAQQSMKGWRRLCPPRSRMPIPLEAIALLAESATHQKLPQIALVLLLTFFLYLRPGEAFKLRVQDIVRPVKRAGKGYKFFSVLLHPTEQGIPSKTLQWDEMLTLDLAVRNFLGPALVQTLELDHRPKQSRAFTVTLDQVNEFMKDNWHLLGLSPLGAPHMYRLRHGGGLIRSDQSVKTNVRDTKQRSVANNEEPAKLRKGEQTVPAIRQPRQKGAKGRASGSKASSKNVPVGALSKEAWLVVPVFLEIFSGTGRLGKSISRICGWPVLLWDIDLGEQYDLCSRANQQRIIHWIQSGMVRGGHLGTPCGSFSRARDRPGGPPQLRSDSCPLGLQGLRPADSKKVAIGNLLMRFTVRVLLLALQLGLAFTVENPQKSRLWLCPPFRRLLRRRFVQQQDVEFCAFGTQWKKSTRFVSTHLVVDNLAPYRCHGAKRGLCAFTGKPHLPLMGQNSTGVWLTKIAEPYPWKLTHVVAKAFLNSDLADIANSFSQYLT